MSEILKNLKSIFITEEGQPQPNPSVSEKEDKPEPVANPSVDFTQGGELLGNVSQKFTKVLLEAIEKHNQEGFDYLEYKNSLKSLSKMAMDEETKYKSAFAMAQTMGTNATKLVSSAKYYKEVLAKEKSKFDQAASLQMNSKVEGRKTEMKSIEADIQKKKKQIETLQKEIKSLEAKLDKMVGTIDKEANKITQTRLDFVASYKNIDDQIGADIEKMTKYLK